MGSEMCIRDRYKDIVSGKKYLSIREWTGRPYNSEQKEIAQLPKIGLQHVTMTYSSEDAYPEIWIDNKKVSIHEVAKNDGLSVEDFVEWFLKESKKGNSVHFAAAATMLLRACGMPARYVVGYAAPASLFKGQADGSYQAVLEDDNAHAWAEVYREGIGWTVVEATPGFAALVTESDGASGQKEADSPDTPGEAFDQEDTPEAETPGIGSRIFRVVKKALATVVLLMTVCGILAVIRRHILCKRRKRGRKGEAPGEQIQRIYRSFAALQKFNKKSVCSCQEERFAKQLGKKYPVFSEKTAQKLANIVLKACYSDQGLTKKECQFVLDCYEKLAEAVSKELSPAKRLAGSLIFCFW